MADDFELESSSSTDSEGSKTTKPLVEFLPSVFEQANEIAQESTILTPSGEQKKEEKIEPIEFEMDDVRDAVTLPFDLAAIISRHKGFELTPEQNERLGKRWLRPFQRYFGTVKGMDMYLAISATVVIVTDKTLDYLEAKEKEKEQKR